VVSLSNHERLARASHFARALPGGKMGFLMSINPVFVLAVFH